MRSDKSLEHKLRVQAIRDAAQTIAGDCSDYQITDYQIMFCASAKGHISTLATSLDELPDMDIINLYIWMIQQEQFCY